MCELADIISVPLEQDNVAVVHYDNQCYFCGNCKWTCVDQMSVLGRYSIEQKKSLCVYCGQCINACPSLRWIQGFTNRQSEMRLQTPVKSWSPAFHRQSERL